MTDRILRRPEVEAITGLARSTIYDRVRKGGFPVPVVLGARCVGWRQSEVEAWVAALSASRNLTPPNSDRLVSQGAHAIDTGVRTNR